MDSRTFARLVLLSTFALPLFLACKDSRYEALLDASPVGIATASSSAASPVATTDAAQPRIADAGVSSWDGAMPVRPIPKGKSLVTASMPPEVQLQTIGYVNAMGQPRFDDAWIDEDYVADLVKKLGPISKSFDKGSTADQAKFHRIEVFGKGRKIELLLANGCSEEMPKRAFVQRAGASLDDLKSHGVLVIACHDQQIECFQSTRDVNDLLCIAAPRHK